MVQNLPIRKFVIGDNAYMCTETLLTPFSGNEKKDPEKDAFNFYLSQLRIRIEQTFGLMTNKWRILRQPLQMNLKNVAKTFMCITRLHNFCIDEGCGNLINMDENLENDLSYIRSDITEAAIPGHSVLRNIIVQELAQRDLERPTFN